MAGNSFYLLAVQTGALAVASVLSALYPVATVILAAVVLHERVTRDHTVGIAPGRGRDRPHRHRVRVDCPRCPVLPATASSSRCGWSRRRMRPTPPRRGRRSVPSTWPASASVCESGVYIEAGAFADVSASVVLVRAESAEAAIALVRDDVYLRNGVWVEVRARAFGRVTRA